jgi:hypothetical protein
MFQHTKWCTSFTSNPCSASRRAKAWESTEFVRLSRPYCLGRTLSRRKQITRVCRRGLHTTRWDDCRKRQPPMCTDSRLSLPGDRLAVHAAWIATVPAWAASGYHCTRRGPDSFSEGVRGTRKARQLSIRPKDGSASIFASTSLTLAVPRPRTLPHTRSPQYITRQIASSRWMYFSTSSSTGSAWSSSSYTTDD